MKSKLIPLLLVATFLSACLANNSQVSTQPNLVQRSQQETALEIQTFKKWLLAKFRGAPPELDVNNIATFPQQWNLPYRSNPNYETLVYYNYKYLFSHLTGDPSTLQNAQLRIPPSGATQKLVIASDEALDASQSRLAQKEMEEHPILSYILYDTDKIVVDEKSPQDRFGLYIDDSTRFRSNSMSRSIVSYLVGHAVCNGYIESENTIIDDWPLLQGTLYQNAKLLDLLNMSAGDQQYVDHGDLIGRAKSRAPRDFEIDTASVAELMGVMRGLPKGSSQYNYSNISTTVVLNYVAYKAKGNFRELLNSVFQDKAGISSDVYFYMIPRRAASSGNLNNMFFATRYDYIRIAKAIMDDWNDDSCVGKYLKRIHDGRIPKRGADDPEFNRTRTYGGQFHFDYPFLSGKTILGLGGAGGQAILISPEDRRIVALHSIHFNNGDFRYDFKGLLLDPFRRRN